LAINTILLTRNHIDLERKMARWGFAATLGLLAVGICVSPTDTSAQGSGIAFVNTETILRGTPGYDAADSILAAERAAYQQEATGLQTQLDSAMTAFDQQQLVLSPQAREEKVTELRTLNDRVQARMEELQNQDMARQRELVAPLEVRIQQVIDGVRAERNLSMIFDSANPNSAIISADPLLDLTELVVSRLQAAGTP
jgi:Skp family chaperone for outer membrane proteins